MKSLDLRSNEMMRDYFGLICGLGHKRAFSTSRETRGKERSSGPLQHVKSPSIDAPRPDFRKSICASELVCSSKYPQRLRPHQYPQLSPNSGEDAGQHYEVIQLGFLSLNLVQNVPIFLLAGYSRLGLDLAPLGNV